MVSVIIPNYNHAIFLEERIESVLNQTWKDFEVIILDDCSTDESRLIIERYRGHEKISAIHFNGKNSGSTFSQWQKGIRLSSGEYIWIAESDDWCEPGFLEHLMQYLLADEKTVLGYTQSFYIRHPGVINWVSMAPKLETTLSGTAFVRQNMVATNSVFNASMAVFRRSAFEKISPEYTNYQFCGDWVFWIEISLQGQVFISGRILNYFRNHESDVSTAAARSGLVFTEQAKLLHYLAARKIIDNTSCQYHLRRLYAGFKVSAHAFSGLQKKRVAKSILPGSRSRLKADIIFYGRKITGLVKRKLRYQ